MELLLWLALGSVVSGGGGGGGAPVRLAPCDDSVGQKWAFVSPSLPPRPPAAEPTRR